MKPLFRPKYNTEEILDNLRLVIESGWTGTGPKCLQFEGEFNEFVGCKDSLFVNSCTSALQLAVRLLDKLGNGPIVSTPITFISTNAVIVMEGHQPVFADVDPDNFSLSPDSVMKKIRQTGARVVMWVHYAGSVHPRFLETANELSRMGVSVIEDCAHAMGACYPGTSKYVGSLSNTISCFSFHSVKNLPTFDSGMLVIPDGLMLERARKLAWLGINKSTYDRTNSLSLYKWQYDCEELGYKFNGNDVAATFALGQLGNLLADNLYRKQIYTWYQQLLGNKVKLLTHDANSSFHFVEILADDRDSLMSKLKDSGYATGVHYIPNYRFRPFAKYYEGDCENCERYADMMITLPVHLEITKEDVTKICSVVNKHCGI